MSKRFYEFQMYYQMHRFGRLDVLEYILKSLCSLQIAYPIMIFLDLSQNVPRRLSTKLDRISFPFFRSGDNVIIINIIIYTFMERCYISLKYLYSINPSREFIFLSPGPKIQILSTQYAIFAKPCSNIKNFHRL